MFYVLSFYKYRRWVSLLLITEKCKGCDRDLLVKCICATEKPEFYAVEICNVVGFGRYRPKLQRQLVRP